jgi:hypothetical protein
MWPPVYAPAKTLLGKLQRGLGSGFLEALETPSEALHPLLMQCITNDPRLDHQLDNRGWYYAGIARQTAMDISPMFDFLVDCESDERKGSYLVVCTLSQMARRGHSGANILLRDYVSWGPFWSSVLRELDTAATTPEWTAVAKTIAERAAQDPDHLPLFGEPYETWSSVEPAVASVTKTNWGNPAAQRRRREARLQKLATPALLKRPGRGSVTSIIRELSTRKNPDEYGALVEAARSSNAMERALALAALIEQADFDLFDQTLQMAVTEQHPPYASRIAQQAALKAEGEVLLPIARKWRTAREWRRRNFAFQVFERYATSEDIRWLRGVLNRVSATKSEELFVLTNVAEIIAARFPGTEFPALGRRFDSFTYSYGRRFLAQALAATDPSFPTTRAFTSLWDCESGVRLVAAEHVSLDVPGARERLREMAEDSLEEDTRVAQAAAARLV